VENSYDKEQEEHWVTTQEAKGETPVVQREKTQDKPLSSAMKKARDEHNADSNMRRAGRQAEIHAQLKQKGEPVRDQKVFAEKRK